VLFIAVDDLRPQLGCYGHNDTLSPHMDAFASTALLFENAHAQIAHCSPSRNSLLSGRVPDHEKVWNFIDDFRDPSVGGPSIVSLPQHFREHGWRTMGAGK
jgi:arylsulfatase A-like enzyme